MAKRQTRQLALPRLTPVAGAAALLVSVFPPLSTLLGYDRQAILAGQLWRLLTAPLVHFSASHLLWDLAVFAAAGWAIEADGERGFGRVCLVSALVPSLYLLLADPQLALYGGLSGPATAAVVYLCLCRLSRERQNRLPWLAILALTAAKILVETLHGAPLFAGAGGVPFRVLPSVHVIGALGAVVGMLWTRGTGERRRVLQS